MPVHVGCRDLGRLGLAALAVACAWGVAGPRAAVAQARPDSLTMSCADLTALLRSRGAAVVASGPTVYDRYVSDGRFCRSGETATPQWLQSRDGRCMLYQCRPATGTMWSN